jgi:hypothetical protein
MDAKVIIEEFLDFLAPKLDVYEQAIYLYALRHSRLQGKEEVTIGFKSARFRMALGIGAQGTQIADKTCYEKLRSLEKKGCLSLLGTERNGTRMKLLLPSEIEGLIPAPKLETNVDLDEIDFFVNPEHRELILRREGGKCFYCARVLNSSNYVIEHVASRPKGDSSYRNVVAACLNCNNRKGDAEVEEFIRGLYRDGYLSTEDFDRLVANLQLLQSGNLRPNITNIGNISAL